MGVMATAYRHMVAAGMLPEAIELALAEMEAAALPRRSKGAERTRRWREKASQIVTSDACDESDVCDADPTPKKVSPEPPSKNTPSPVPPNGGTPARDFFEEFWKAYPKRDGDNPRKPAKQKFGLAVRKGADPEVLIAAARALATRHPTPTSFVPTAVTWLNQERWADEQGAVPVDSSKPIGLYVSLHDPTWEWFAARYRREHFGRSPPNDKGGGWYFPEAWQAEAEASRQKAGTG